MTGFCCVQKTRKKTYCNRTISEYDSVLPVTGAKNRIDQGKTEGYCKCCIQEIKKNVESNDSQQM